VGGYTDWLRQRRESAVAARTPPSERAAPAAARPPAPKPRKLSYKDQRELDALPGLIQRLELEQAKLTAAIGDPDFYRHSPQEAGVAVHRLKSVEQELEGAFSRWETLEAASLS